MRPVLYSFRRCPYAMRARMALIVAGIEVELREVLLRHKPAEMLEASPKGTVPVMVLENGDVLEESFDIMLWALATHDPENWLRGERSVERRDILELARGVETDFKPHLDRYKYPNRYTDEPAADHRALAMRFLKEHLVPRLETHRNLFGEWRGLADVAIFPFVRQFANTDSDSWARTAPQSLQDWLSAYVESDLFTLAMVKNAPWQSGKTGAVFPGSSSAAVSSAILEV